MGSGQKSKHALVDELGCSIVSGHPYRPGDVLSLDRLISDLRVSRSMAREVLQVLHQKGLIGLRPRVGATVLPIDQWNVFDARVIDWRLRVAPRFQMRSLVEVRRAIEPWAANLAAQRASASVGHELVSLSQELKALGLDNAFKDLGDRGKELRRRYLAVDMQFHEALLKGSQNEMFSALAEPVKTALAFRIEQDLAGTPGRQRAATARRVNRFPQPPIEAALWFHHGLAHAVAQGCPEAAEAFARAILAEIENNTLPDRLQVELSRALNLLNPSGMGKDWDRFSLAITAGVRS